MAGRIRICGSCRRFRNLERRLGAALGALLLSVCAGPIVVMPASASGGSGESARSDLAACNTILKRPRDFDQTTEVGQGVAGVIKTPAQATLAGWATNRPSMASLRLDSSSYSGDLYTDYVAIGWYVGSYGGLPYASQPRVYYEEFDAGSVLRRDGANLGWNAYHTLSIWPHDPGSVYNDFYFYVDGVFRTSTVGLHDRYNTASFAGEVRYTCTDMDARAQKSSAPYSTLKVLRKTSTDPGTWYEFNDQYVNDLPYYIGSPHGPGTAFAYGP